MDPNMESQSKDVELIETCDLVEMLEFELRIFNDIVNNDGLVVAAKGLHLSLVISNILKVYCDSGNLVLVLNANEHEEKYFMEKLNRRNVYSTTFSASIQNREDIYLSGGINFITTRIVVVDMLKKRIPIEKITGIVILRAHTIFESCQEAFVLRLYRQHNKTGFIKAFTNSAQSFTVGFGHVERVMRALFVKELFIWPRFHSLVIQSLKQFEPNVIEIHIPITETMKKIQSNILELMNLTVKEIKKANKTVELQEITVENCLTKKFHKILQAQLDVIWHQLSQKSRQLIAELRTLRHLILTLFYADFVTFYSILSGYRTMEYAYNANWVLCQPAQSLFANVSSLIFTGDQELNPEFCPKWNYLLELLRVEIPQEIKKAKNKDNKILILCSDNKTCYQLNQILSNGPYYYLYTMAAKRKIRFKTVNEKLTNINNLLNINSTTDSKIDKGVNSADIDSKKLKKSDSKDSTDGTLAESCNNKPKESEDVEENEDFQNSYVLTMSQFVDESDNEESVIFEPFSQLEKLDLTQICEAMEAPTVLIQTFKGNDNYVCLQKTLHDLKPSFIIMYHSHITAVREIEMYEAHRDRTTPLVIYFLIHADTVEEQSYLTSLRREKEAFEFLIETKSKMVVPEDQDGKSDQCLALQRDMSTPEKNTRQGGNEPEPTRKSIIVDMREFRSELPALIHKRGIDIEPVTITVGDYILTRDICVERKSLSDLIGSLNSGRLYQQCNQMSRYYAKPMLLIEFDQNKQFSWQNHYMLSTDDTDNFDIQQKLLLLTLHFPKLKLIWSPSPYASAQLFEELKQGKEEPDVAYASSIGSELDQDVIESKYNSNLYDFVRKLPGITSKNIDIFLRNGKTLNDYINKTEDELKKILGNTADAKAFYDILHNDHNPKGEINAKSVAFKSKGRFRGGFRGKK